MERLPFLLPKPSDRAKSTSVSSLRFGDSSSIFYCELTRIFQKHEAAVKAAEAAIIEESMLSKEALAKAEAEFEKYEMKLVCFCFELMLICMRLSVAMKEASGYTYPDISRSCENLL
jgi:hypothetical protein